MDVQQSPNCMDANTNYVQIQTRKKNNFSKIMLPESFACDSA